MQMHGGFFMPNHAPEATFGTPWELPRKKRKAKKGAL